jgi:S1-C subfamily serine protease
LIDQGYVQYSYLGISGSDVTLSLIETFDLPNNTRGVVVAEAVQGGPAARAGLQSMGAMVQSDNGEEEPVSVDIITAINGSPVNGMDDLIGYLAQQTQPGDEVTLTILRDGTETLVLNAHLTPRP